MHKYNLVNWQCNFVTLVTFVNILRFETIMFVTSSYGWLVNRDDWVCDIWIFHCTLWPDSYLYFCLLLSYLMSQRQRSNSDAFQIAYDVMILREPANWLRKSAIVRHDGVRNVEGKKKTEYTVIVIMYTSPTVNRDRKLGASINIRLYDNKYDDKYYLKNL